MKKIEFDNETVRKVSSFIQEHMKENHLEQISADECAKILAENSILSDKIGPKPGFHFRQLLRDGRDGKVDKVSGVYQSRPHTKWIIKRKK